MSDDREGAENMVAALIDEDQRNRNPKLIRATLGILASLLRQDRLPQSGREFVAGILAKIARGDDPRSILPKNHHRVKGKNPVQVLSAVEIAKAKRGMQQADEDLYKSVGEKLGLKKPGSVKTRASIAGQVSEKCS
jgi:hypothetical protein